MVHDRQNLSTRLFTHQLQIIRPNTECKAHSIVYQELKQMVTVLR